jgi:hypothetical protein
VYPFRAGGPPAPLLPPSSTRVHEVALAEPKSSSSPWPNDDDHAQAVVHEAGRGELRMPASTIVNVRPERHVEQRRSPTPARRTRAQSARLDVRK